MNVQHVVISLEFINRLFKSDLLKSGGAIPEGHYEELTIKQTVVPFRNGIMMAIVANAAHVWSGGKHSLLRELRIRQFIKRNVRFPRNQAISVRQHAYLGDLLLHTR